jgi:magnesium chelatase family protein
MAAAVARDPAASSLVLPADNASEAALIKGLRTSPATTLAALVAQLGGDARHEQSREAATSSARHPLLPDECAAMRTHEIAAGRAARLPAEHATASAAGEITTRSAPGNTIDFAEVKGHHAAKRALEIAAAGRHSALLVGPPGSGKSLLAVRLPSILPPMTEDEALEASAVASLVGRFDSKCWGRRPFRAPHHSASTAALVGGGANPRPGEISLAHCGVLFLDELPEFGRQALEALREPLETGRIALSRAARQIELPAEFQLIAAMNPCPCGYLGDERCRCSPEQVLRYQGRLSGPLLDRIDLQVVVRPVDEQTLSAPADGERSAVLAERVARASARQSARQGFPNAALGPAGIDEHCPLEGEALALLQATSRRMRWSSRTLHRVQRLARTIADLAGRDRLEAADVGEAIGYRRALAVATPISSALGAKKPIPNARSSLLGA